jgi:hypothetical protein
MFLGYAYVTVVLLGNIMACCFVPSFVLHSAYGGHMEEYEAVSGTLHIFHPVA